ncbi:hypothetical protein A6V39_03995 [Candidatus Mycoplasma haematobovis]|uniref:Uncharacterized protein n=1 Tax=Candidatus Mycoplasma haematobovis TaxID=432608 RepID=A0A1A9QED4_9MOLU|nr:hypothetical protein [Candidatus Mycoplasma haematobovis]OAL10050.1 hypothetical protein A6V39_03995 [Candidatus Mycoplasma haematobovis]
MAKLKIALTILLSALGVFGANKYYSPKSIKDLLKWQGIRLASDDRAWRSTFYDHKDKLNEMGIKSHEELWTWCSEKFKQTNLDDQDDVNKVKEFCADNATSIMGRIIRDGEEGRIISPEDHKSFAIGYVLTGLSEDVLKLVGLDESQKQNFDYVGLKISEWCEKNKNSKVVGQANIGLYSNFKKRCYQKGVKTVSELLAKEKADKMLDTDSFKKRFDDELTKATKLIGELKEYMKKRKESRVKAHEAYKRIREASVKDAEEIKEWDLRELEKINNEIPENLSDEQVRKNGGQYLKWWCEDRVKASLLDTGMFPYNYSIIKYRCTGKA